MKKLHKEEREANEFAMCLLMPEDMVRREMRKVKRQSQSEDKVIATIAEIFQVPVVVATVRLLKLGYLRL